MRCLVTGGAGFIGRWVVARLLSRGYEIWLLDSLANGSEGNLVELVGHPRFRGFTKGDIRNASTVDTLFNVRFDICFHLAACINVQVSLDRPQETFTTDVIGTFNVLEACRRFGTKVVFISTCMVYERALDGGGIDENHPVRARSPYAASKLAGEHLALSYHDAYGLPVTVLRLFNTYGPFQRVDGEGGVVGIFLSRKLAKQPLNVYGDGTQTRDLLYVEDCAEFVVRAGENGGAVGHVLNAGTGHDVAINDLAAQIARGSVEIRHVPHIHPQSEIAVLRCNAEKTQRLLDWRAQVSLDEGLERTERWIRQQKEAAGRL